MANKTSSSATEYYPRTTKTKTSVGMETADQTVARAKALIGGSASTPPPVPEGAPNTAAVPTPTLPKPTNTETENSARSVLYDLTPFNEDSRRGELLRQNRERIADIDKVYDGEVQGALKNGERDMARSNTISAMTGNMGGIEAQTRGGNSDRRTKEEVNLINDRRRLEIQSIYKEVDDNVRKEKEAALATQRENSKNVLAEIATSAAGTLNKFATQGFKWEDLEKSDPETVATLVRQTGKDPFELKLLYEQSMPQPPKAVFEGFKGDNFVRITQNEDGSLSTTTKTAKDLGIPKDTDVATVTFGGNVYWYDKNSPVDESGQPKLTKLGTSGKGTGTTTVEGPVDEDGALLSFEEWKLTPQAKQIVSAAKSQSSLSYPANGVTPGGLQSLTTQGSEKILRDAYNEGLREYKRTGASKGKNWTAVNIPNSVKEDLIADATGGATLDEIYAAYPDVSSSYVSSLFNSLKKKKESGSEISDEDFLKALAPSE